MALTIGGGISFGAGISLGPVADTGGGGGSSPSPNTFTIAELVYDANSTYDGASTISGFTFGTLTSDYIEGVYLYRASSSNNQDGYTFIRPKDGTYSGFSISGGGLIDGDTPSYPRNFIVNGTTYRFHCDGYQYFLRTGDPIQLQGSVGETFPIIYDPNNQPSITPNTMFVESYSYYTSYYGANTDISGLVQGELFSDYFKSIVYTNSNGMTTIVMKDGSYTGFTVSGGGIDGDTNAATRYFNVNGQNVLFTNAAGAYTVSTDVFNLQSAAGTSVSVVYDPAAQSSGGGGGGGNPSGTITVGTDGTGRYGFFNGMYGSASISPNVADAVYYFSMGNITSVQFINGNYSGLVIENSTYTIGGETTVTVTVGGVSQTGTLESGGPGPRVSFTGDVFSLLSKNGQTLAVTIVPGSGASSGGGSVTYTSGTDYSNGNMTPPGIYVSDMGSGSYMLMVDTNAWSNSTAYTAYTSLTQGTTFTVTMPLTSSTPYTMTLTTNWTASGPGLTAQATSSSPLTLGSGPDNVPSSVTLAGSGGGGADITGTAQLLYNGYSGVGAAKGGIGGYGTLTSTPDVVQFFQYSSGFMATLIMFVEGSSSGLTISNADINGHTTISVTCNGVTASSVGGTVDMGGTYLRFTIPGDPFGIEAATGTSKDFSITLA